MAPLIVLMAVTALARAAGALGVAYASSWVDATAIGLAAMFVVTAIAHFVPARRAGLVAIVPPVLPHPQMVVTITGVLEMAGAAALLVPVGWGSSRVFAAWALALLLVAMFPANVYASRERRSAHSPQTPLGRRTAMQVIFIGATLFVALAS